MTGTRPIAWLLGAVLCAGTAAASDSATADRHYAAGNFDKALAQYTLLSAGSPKDAYLRMRMLQCRLALGELSPAQERELRDLRTAWGREVSRRLSEVRDTSVRAQSLARTGKIDEASNLLNTAEETLNALSREVDVTAGRRQVADARRFLQTAAAAPARRDRPAGDAPSPFAGRYRSVKEGDHYRIVLVQEEGKDAKEKAALDAPLPAPKGAPAPREPVEIYPQGVLPDPDKIEYEEQNGGDGGFFNLWNKDGIWQRREFEGQPLSVQNDVLRAAQYNRIAPKYRYERWLDIDRERSFAEAMVQLRRDSQMPRLCLPHDYVVELPKGVDYRKPAVEEVSIGADGKGMETVLYDLSTVLLPTDGPFDGISYTDYQVLGYRGLFALGLVGGYGVGGGYGGYGGFNAGISGQGVPFAFGRQIHGGGGGSGAVTTGSAIINGSAEDFAYGYPYVLNYFFGDRFGWHDPAQTAALLQTLNTIVRDPSLMPMRPANRPPAPMPVPEKKQ
jgi:hypothetical protein